MYKHLTLPIKNLMHYICLKNSERLDNYDYQPDEFIYSFGMRKDRSVCHRVDNNLM